MAKYAGKSNITFMPVVESINRKFALRREKAGVQEVNQRVFPGIQFMGAGTRSRYYVGVGSVKTNYFFMRKYARGTSASADEIAARARFGEIVQWIAAARKDLTQISLWNMKWKDAKEDTSRTIKGVSALANTFYSWAFNIAGKMYDEDGSLPSSHALPNFDA